MLSCEVFKSLMSGAACAERPSIDWAASIFWDGSHCLALFRCSLSYPGRGSKSHLCDKDRPGESCFAVLCLHSGLKVP